MPSETKSVFRRSLRRVFRIAGFERYGLAELAFASGDTIFVEPEFLRFVGRGHHVPAGHSRRSTRPAFARVRFPRRWALRRRFSASVRPQPRPQLSEIARVRQVPGEPVRRWFASPDLDLVVWCDAAGLPVAFQLCYDKLRSERALTWKRATGFVHRAVDAGEDDAGLRYKATPILIDDGYFDAKRVVGLFMASSERVPPDIREFVAARLRQHPDPVRGA